MAGAAKRPKKSAPAATLPGASPAFERVVAAMRGGDGIEAPSPSKRAFGSNGLKVNGRIFAMLVRGAFVVKLPKDRVDALVAAGAGTHFEPGPGRVMREWIALRGAGDDWLDLAREALAFVKAGAR